MKLFSLFILLINTLSVLSVTVYQIRLDPQNNVNIKKQPNADAEVVGRLSGQQTFFSPYNSLENGYAHFYKGYIESVFLGVPTGKNCRVVANNTMFRVGPNMESIAVLSQNDVIKCFGTDQNNTQWMVTSKGYVQASSVFILNEEDTNINKKRVAIDVYNYFEARGWSRNAICAMLGNMEYESNLVPSAAIGNGYGLVQWRPSSLLTKWAIEKRLDYKLVSTQCRRIGYELNAKLQYTVSPYCSLTFAQFTKSNQSIEILTRCFMYNYEKSSSGLINRVEYAKKWNAYF